MLWSAVVRDAAELGFGRQVVLARTISCCAESWVRRRWKNSLLGRLELTKKLQKPSAGTGAANSSSIFFELVRDSTMFWLWHSRLYSMVMLVKLCVSKCSSGTLCNQQQRYNSPTIIQINGHALKLIWLNWVKFHFGGIKILYLKSPAHVLEVAHMLVHIKVCPARLKSNNAR